MPAPALPPDDAILDRWPGGAAGPGRAMRHPAQSRTAREVQPRAASRARYSQPMVAAASAVISPTS